MQPAPDLMPATDAVQMIEPRRCLVITRAAYLAVRKLPIKLILSISAQRSAVSSKNGIRPPLIPAFAKHTSRLPYSSTAVATAPAISSSADESLTRALARPPAARIAATVASTSGARSNATTAAPSAANSSALARPIPLAAPVTRAVFACKIFMGYTAEWWKDVRPASIAASAASRRHRPRCLFYRARWLFYDEAVTNATPPLDGIMVLDFTHALAGPYCTMLMATYGATVIKVEEPEQGDMGRAWGPPFQGSDAAYFVGLNSGKKSLAIDLKTPEGLENCRRLAAIADIVIENFRPGTMNRLGLDYASLSAANPRLIYVSISGYGQTGPKRLEPAMDLIVQSACGLMSIT